MNNQNNTNILFYSQKCEYCRNLLLLLRNENLLCYFKLICVDDKLDKFPPDMQVPMMVVNNVNKPLIAQETFKWIEQIKYIRSQQVMDINKKIIQQNSLNSTIKKGPIGFDNDIMTSVSDKFAFTKVESACPQSYFGVGQEDKNVIFTAPEHDKINKTNQLKLIKDLESRREQQDSDNATTMKQKQMEAVMNTEQEKLLSQSNNNLQSQQVLQQQMMQQQMMQQQMMQQQMMQQQMMQQQMMQNRNNYR
ncbi:hypothetical protein QKU48_gp0523 [Fadolivirus algeromassiliense]|jgi:hypothetical protein|uniref:Glutaredoxin n=1 Tax=Fadolivirus FV1/VV64 TaxID=3070911 RepID=A0A7D3R0U3_9VIRU|nr:hypothetical protein QKU48_gp0523 [Fadolivirus algeromassiliense]QKF93981.1 hypothetical protein Fadolivirus_1_523 [Fadolivirus FV1/VV64]